MSGHLDWFNFMSYDIHGTWNGGSEYTSAVANPHTNLTGIFPFIGIVRRLTVAEIALGLELLWRNDIDPAQVMLGLAFYGRLFTLEDPSCDSPGCPFSGGGHPGSCTATSGILSDYEINRVLEEYSPPVAYDPVAAVNWISWEEDQWYASLVSMLNDLLIHLGCRLTMQRRFSRKGTSLTPDA